MFLRVLSGFLFKPRSSTGGSAWKLTEVTIQPKLAKEAKRSGQHSLFFAIGIDTMSKTAIEASAMRTVHVFTLPLAGESGSQARRGTFNLSHEAAIRLSVALPGRYRVRRSRKDQGKDV